MSLPDDKALPRHIDSKIDMSMPDHFQVGKEGQVLEGFFSCLFIYGSGAFAGTENVKVKQTLDYATKMSNLGPMFGYGQFILS